jgi:hypothetical protein
MNNNHRSSEKNKVNAVLIRETKGISQLTKGGEIMISPVE